MLNSSSFGILLGILAVLGCRYAYLCKKISSRASPSEMECCCIILMQISVEMLFSFEKDFENVFSLSY